jgi:NAD(P)-dependent dehydrogenase (short-subunit alcohol dehydrogenase family)
MALLKDQVVLVTGCSTGIGRAFVRELKARGHRPFATARRPESLAELEREGIEALPLDVTDPASIQRAVAGVLQRAGRVDVLVNNAGVNLFGPVAELTIDEVRAVFETNVLGLVAVTQAVFPHMAERGSGRIVNVGSVVGLLATPFAAAYCASKAAVHTLSEAFRIEAAPFGIDVVVVQPGGVASEIAASGSRVLERFGADSSRYQRFYGGIRKRAGLSQSRAMPADAFARELVRRAFAAKAPRIIRLGTGSGALPRMARMPGSLRDGLLARTYGLAPPRSRR